MHEIDIPKVQETVYHKQLDNGLDVYLYPKQDMEKTFAIFSTNYGSIDQSFSPINQKEMVTVPDGIAHFLEHKMFEKEDGDVFQQFSERGASANAFTSFTETAYLFSSTTEIEANVETLLDFVQNPYFTEESVEKEKGIIEQEIRMYDDQPDWRLFFGTIGSMYRHHPVRIDIAGTVDSINDITADDLYTCYNTFYHPGNMQLVIAGQFDAQQMMHLVEENQSAKTFDHSPEINRDYGDEPIGVDQNEKTIKMPINTPKCMVGIKEKPDALEPDVLLENDLIRDLALDIYFSKSGLHYESLYQEGLIIDSLRLEYMLEKSFGFTAIGASTMEPEKFGERVKEMLHSIKTDQINQDAFERVKKKKYGELLREYNNLETVANNVIQYHQLGLDFRDVFPTLEQLTVDRFQEKIQSWIDDDQITVCSIVPEGE
ncbi:EF-P 5-aminopentanol modification-associated protein YfmH [Alkalibacillus almallahensis]|uniref:EF-P 5-aminopentanol modification-associated protein YfmH n=1 Tax=Alkalibacillus almallahensis TaxID=1379154 RepID=UPI001420816C|nr:pitrilysin family protein [Alkalibacillus almallahensis]NIK10849.1 putative Zn-dependent peptidase [Alkalibacillus almallahensis]